MVYDPIGCEYILSDGSRITEIEILQYHKGEIPTERYIPKKSGVSEVRIVDEKTGGAKGQKNCQMGALDPLALGEVGKVAGFGGVKYERYNFAKGYKWSLSYDALHRHLMAFWGGENTDEESGLPHLAHAAWHCLALMTFSLRGLGTDDRFPSTQPSSKLGSS